MAGLTSAVLLVGALVGAWFTYTEALDALGRIQRAQADAAAARIHGFVGRTAAALQATTVKFDLADIARTDELRVELASLLRHYPEISELSWRRADDQEQMAVRRFSLGSMAVTRHRPDPLLARARRDGLAIGPVYFRQDSEPHLSMAAAKVGGRSVLTAQVNLTDVRDVLVMADPDAVTYLVDAGGRLIAHPDITRVLARADVSPLPQVARHLRDDAATGHPVPGLGLDGQPVLASVAAVGDLGWRVIVEQPRSVAMRPVVSLIGQSVALTAVGLVAALAVSFALARRMVLPIRAIEEQARRLGDGQFDRRIAVSGADELGSLATQFNRMAARLQEIHQSQEARIAERTRALAQADAAKTRFIAVASHDLRQPIHALSLFVQQMKQRPLDPVTLSLATQLERAAESLSSLIESLLDVSQLDIGGIVPQRSAVDLHELLERVATRSRPEAVSKNLRLRVGGARDWVDSDPVLLERILQNLVTNAVRYTMAGGVLLAARRRGEAVEVVVADTGIGIAAQHLPRLFDELYRVHPTAGGVSGMGLGLSIVRRLCDLLDHAVDIASTPGRGTTARLRMPRVAPPPTQPPDRIGSPVEPLRGARVLLIDDDDDARAALGGLLREWGCTVQQAADGTPLQQAGSSPMPQLLICDLMLQDGQTGLDLVTGSRTSWPQRLPCLFVTGAIRSAVAAQARDAGYQVLAKPVAPARLRAMMHHLLQTQEDV